MCLVAVLTQPLRLCDLCISNSRLTLVLTNYLGDLKQCVFQAQQSCFHVPELTEYCRQSSEQMEQCVQTGYVSGVCPARRLVLPRLSTFARAMPYKVAVGFLCVSSVSHISEHIGMLLSREQGIILHYILLYWHDHD